MKDKNGRAYATVADTKAGSVLETDDGFTCMPQGAHKTVHEDDYGELYLHCAGEGEQHDPQTERHGLNGQLDNTGTFYVGLYPVN